LPELQLATMGLAELRLMARRERLFGYTVMGRQRLTNRLMRRLSKRRGTPRTL
jgi:hypothetical protein